MKQAVLLGIFSIVNMALGFLAQWYVLTQLGAGMESDAYFTSIIVPQVILLMISGSLTHVLVPLFSGESNEVFVRDAWGFVILIAGVFGTLAIVLHFSAPWWVSATVPGFDEHKRALTVDLTRIQLLGMVFSAVNGVQWAAYHAKQRFITAELTPMLAGLLTFLALLWLLPRHGVVAAAWLNVGRAVLQTVLLLPGMGRPNGVDCKSPTLNEAWKRIKPLLLGSAYYKTDPLVDRFLLSNSTSGNLSIYHLAQQIYSAINQIINKAVTAPLVPLFSSLYKAGRMSDFRYFYYYKIKLVAFIGILGLLIFGFFGEALLALFMGYGHYTIGDVNNLWWVMIWLGGTFLGGALGLISSSAFYAIGDTATPTRIGILSYTLYVPVKVLAFYWHGVMGLAISTSGFLLVNFLFQNAFIRHALDPHQRIGHDDK